MKPVSEAVQQSYRAASERFLNTGTRLMATRGLQVRRSDIGAILDAFEPELRATFAELWRAAYTQGTKDMLETGPLRLDRPTPFDPEEQPAPQVRPRPMGAWE